MSFVDLCDSDDDDDDAMVRGGQNVNPIVIDVIDSSDDECDVVVMESPPRRAIECIDLIDSEDDTPMVLETLQAQTSTDTTRQRPFQSTNHHHLETSPESTQEHGNALKPAAVAQQATETLDQACVSRSMASAALDSDGSKSRFTRPMSDAEGLRGFSAEDGAARKQAPRSPVGRKSNLSVGAKYEARNSSGHSVYEHGEDNRKPAARRYYDDLRENGVFGDSRAGEAPFRTQPLSSGNPSQRLTPLLSYGGRSSARQPPASRTPVGSSVARLPTRGNWSDSSGDEDLMAAGPVFSSHKKGAQGAPSSTTTGSYGVKDAGKKPSPSSMPSLKAPANGSKLKPHTASPRKAAAHTPRALEKNPRSDSGSSIARKLNLSSGMKAGQNRLSPGGRARSLMFTATKKASTKRQLSGNPEFIALGGGKSKMSSRLNRRIRESATKSGFCEAKEKSVSSDTRQVSFPKRSAMSSRKMASDAVSTERNLVSETVGLDGPGKMTPPSKSETLSRQETDSSAMFDEQPTPEARIVTDQPTSCSTADNTVEDTATDTPTSESTPRSTDRSSPVSSECSRFTQSDSDSDLMSSAEAEKGEKLSPASVHLDASKIDSIMPWTRRSRKTVNYSEPGDLEIPESEAFLPDKAQYPSGESDSTTKHAQPDGPNASAHVKEGEASMNNPTPKRKRGRPKKVKRKRGRPKKVELTRFGSDSELMSSAAVEREENQSPASFHLDASEMDSTMPWTRISRKTVNYSESGDGPNVSADTKEDEESMNRRASKRKRGRPKKLVEESPARPGRLHLDSTKGVFTCIEHLSKYTYCDGLYPTHYFSVLSIDDEIFDFSITVRESGITGAGLGAFLTFLGARVLNNEKKQERDQKLESRIPREIDTQQPLEALTPDGFGVSVYLTGVNLHGNRNLPFWPETAVPLQARLPGGKTLHVNLAGYHLHCDDSEDEEEPLNLSICPKRVGALGIHTESDYAQDSRMEFSTELSLVDLGRYGPVLKTDRKPELHYDIKNYIFSEEPSSWGFGVTENLGSTKQMVDITDDATGEPHKEVRKLIPSYINEVGHDQRLKANVHALEKADRSVHYYLDLDKPLKKGDVIELLTNYDGIYESVRERKGYGIANVENGKKGDSHEPSALLRNFEERDHTAKLIEDCLALQLFLLLDFVTHSILQPIFGITEAFLDPSRMCPVEPTSLQWVARLRMHWLSQLCAKRIVDLRKMLVGFESPFPYQGILDQADQWALQMQWPSFGKTLLSLRDCAQNDEQSARVYQTLQIAAREEILYTLSQKIVSPLDESMWCPVAVTLIEDLCDCTAVRSSSHNLMANYLDCARKAARAIQQACNDYQRDAPALSKIAFTSGVTVDTRIDERMLKSFRGFKRSEFFCENTTTPKGITAWLLELQAYHDVLDLGFLPKQAETYSTVLKPSTMVLIANNCSTETARCREEDADVVGYPRLTKSFETGSQINEQWYILWQVMYIVYSFAAEFVAQPSESLLKDICHAIGADLAQARAVVKRGMVKRDDSEGAMPKPRARANSNRPRQKAPIARGPSINKSLFDGIVWETLSGLGWHLDVGTRPTDFYFLPPGVERKRGFSNRVDYFDSVTLVMKFIATDPRWKDRAEVVKCLDLFERASKLREKRKMPKSGCFDLDSLLSQLEGDEK